EGVESPGGRDCELELPLSPRVGHDDLHAVPGPAPEQRDDDAVGLATRELVPAFTLRVHGIVTSLTVVTVVRAATKNGSNARASASLSASTCHQIAWPPVRQDAMVGCRRRELSWPRKEAKTTPHSSA